MITLTDEQKAFINHDPKRHARVMAGPGAGKSFTSVAYLQELAKNQPDLRVRMLTFTRAATAEFAEKMRELGLSGPGMVAPATVHSYALAILMKARGAGLPMPLSFASDWQTERLIRPYIARRLRNSGHGATASKIKKLEEEMSAGWQSLDENMVTLADVEPALSNAYRGFWSQHRQVFGYVLLGELPYRAGQALEDHDDIDPGIDLLLADEYQDLNKADIKMLRLLADRGVVIVAIGDDDQSIYGWRMAAPPGILNFLTDYSTIHDYPLTYSLRCGGEALSAANALIQTSPGRRAKPAMRVLDKTPATKIASLRFDVDAHEVKAVADIVEARLAAGVPSKKIALLVRSNVDAWGRRLAAALAERGIALANTKSVEAILKSDNFQQLMAKGQIAANHTHSLAWWTLLELKPNIGPAFIDYLYGKALERGVTFGEVIVALAAENFPDAPPRAGASGAKAINDVLALVSALQVPDCLLGSDGWGAWLIANLTVESLSDEAVRLLNQLDQELGSLMRVDGYLAEIERTGKDLAEKSLDGVRLMSMGQSKGLTFDTAILLGVEEGLVPLERNTDQTEEIRLLYVAMTRATGYCILTWVRRRTDEIAYTGNQNVGRTRRRSPLLEHLPLGEPQDGPAYVAAEFSAVPAPVA